MAETLDSCRLSIRFNSVTCPKCGGRPTRVAGGVLVYCYACDERSHVDETKEWGKAMSVVNGLENDGAAFAPNEGTLEAKRGQDGVTELVWILP